MAKCPPPPTQAPPPPQDNMLYARLRPDSQCVCHSLLSVTHGKLNRTSCHHGVCFMCPHRQTDRQSRVCSNVPSVDLQHLLDDFVPLRCNQCWPSQAAYMHCIEADAGLGFFVRAVYHLNIHLFPCCIVDTIMGKLSVCIHVWELTYCACSDRGDVYNTILQL